ncbi:Subtilisin-like protease [Hordeum vulgare]|nr:Subtilisin-like protease [Hordeum vulgare]
MAPSGRLRHQNAVTARSEDQSFPWNNMTGNESRNDAFKKGASCAAAGPSKDGSGFHPGHVHRAAPSHGSAQEHRATTTRAAAPASKTLPPPHTRPDTPQPKRRAKRFDLSHPWEQGRSVVLGCG